MPARESESLVLRTYPYREADLIVSFVSRDRGKLRGIARAARRPKSRWGSGLERLSHVHLHYFLRENQELARLDSCELLRPPIFLKADYSVSVALDFLAEVTDKLLPDHEPNDPYFRLLLLVLDEIREGMSGKLAAVKTPALGTPASNGQPAGKQSEGPTESSPGRSSDIAAWLARAMTYFGLWSLRLGGWLPPLNVCIESGVELGPDETAYFERLQDGLVSADFRGPDSWALRPASRRLANAMLRRSLPDLREQVAINNPPHGPSDDLFRFVTQRLEFHFEQRLKTARVLSQL
jgi:DNA repair protein RecO (recombination protein O)